jgi:hypothetical protein
VLVLAESDSNKAEMDMKNDSGDMKKKEFTRMKSKSIESNMTSLSSLSSIRKKF